MKKTSFYLLLGAEAVALTALSLFAGVLPKIFSAVAAFPFEQIGLGLSALAGLGRIGNGLAVLIWLGLSALPLLLTLDSWGRRDRLWENLALCLLSIVLAVGLYTCARPVDFAPELMGGPVDDLGMIRTLAGVVIWSAVLCPLIFRILRRFREGDRAALLGYGRVMLRVLCALFVVGICLGCLGELTDALRAASAPADTPMAVLRFLAAALPYAADVVITLLALKLLDGEIEAAILSRACCGALGLIAAADAALNLIQLWWADSLSSINANVTVPVVSLAFVLAVLLIVRLMEENKRLSEDNSLFI